MRTFEHPNLNDFVCPICKTSDDRKVLLIGIPGTEDGGNMEAQQYHSDCVGFLIRQVVERSGVWLRK